MRARLIGTGLLLLSAACGGRGISLTVLFPSVDLAHATSMIELELFLQSGTSSTCQALVLDEKPSSAVSRVAHRLAPFPFSSGDLRLDSIEEGTHAALVTGWNLATKRERFLRGCIPIPADARDVNLTVSLSEQRGCCRPDNPACSSAANTTCYDGPSHTAGRGPCVKGTASCIGSFFSSCVGQVLPSAETCNGVDDDCDGVVDNACSGADGGKARDGGGAS
ncbi:MAG: hypothetical protein ACOY3Y_00225 [Acidobacteriota bacterium]